MSGQHDREKHQIAVKFHHRIWRKIEKDANAHRMKPGEYIRWVVTERAEGVKLTAADARLIAERIAAAEEKGKMV